MVACLLKEYQCLVPFFERCLEFALFLHRAADTAQGLCSARRVNSPGHLDSLVECLKRFLVLILVKIQVAEIDDRIDPLTLVFDPVIVESYCRLQRFLRLIEVI